MSMQSMETSFSSSSNKIAPICVHCCVPLRGHSDVPHNDNNIQQSFSPHMMSSSCDSTQSGTKPLYSIFKLHYLKAFENLDWEEEESDLEQLTLLCFTCNQLLTNLYQLYEDFFRLGQIESSLNKKVKRLNEIIDCHAQKRIHCDLIPNIKSADHNLVSNCVNDPVPAELAKTLSSSRVHPSSRYPLVRLLRLPEKNTKLTTTTRRRHADDVDYSNDDSSSFHDDDGDDDYNPVSPIVKMEDDDNEEIETLLNIKVESMGSDDDMPLKPRTRKNRKRSAKSSKGQRLRVKKQKNNSMKSILDSPNPKTKNKSKNKNSTTKEKPSNSGIPECKAGYFYAKLKEKFPNPCWYCDQYDFATPADCLNHTKKKHLPKVDGGSHPITVCKRCSKMCPRGYKLHLKKCLLIPSGSLMDKRFRCQECGYSTVRQCDLNTHMLSHQSVRSYSCDLCDFRAKTNNVLYNHKKSMHSNLDQERIKCDECDRFLKNEQAVKAHKIIMHTEEGYKKYREREKQKLARKRQATRERILPTFCQDCHTDLVNRLAFCNHRRTVHGDSMGHQFTCETCGTPFTTRGGLLIHLKQVHSDARPFICDTCGKSFKRGYTLSRHVEQTHTEEGRLKCNAQAREGNRRRKMVKLQLANSGIMGQQQTEDLSNDNVSGSFVYENPVV